MEIDSIYPSRKIAKIYIHAPVTNLGENYVCVQESRLRVCIRIFEDF
jgi:hypothetical protein